MKKILVSSLIVIVVIINCIFLFNKSFYKTRYKGLFIPRFSFFIRCGGCEVATFYSLKSKENLEKEINENIHYNNSINYFKYTVTDSDFYRIIYLEFDPLS